MLDNLLTIQQTIAQQGSIPSHEAAREAAEGFEAVVLNTLMSAMFKDVSQEGAFGGGHAEETYRGLLVEEYSKTIARAGGIGIADAVYRDLIKLQEGA